MALEATFRNLSAALDLLHDALNTLHVMVGDKPMGQDLAVIDGLENALLDTLGELHEARKAALDARRAVGPHPDLDRARRTLTACQQRFHRIEQQFSLNLVSYEKLKQLVRLGEKGKEWRSWADSTRQDIEQCRQPLEQISKALADCWQELAERLGTTSISVRNAVVGQKVVASDPRAKDELAERLT
jgi:hypothetical protein